MSKPLLDEKVVKFARDPRVKAVFKSEDNYVTYCFVTKFVDFSKFGKEALLEFRKELFGDGNISGIVLTVIPELKNPENYGSLEKCIYKN